MRRLRIVGVFCLASLTLYAGCHQQDRRDPADSPTVSESELDASRRDQPSANVAEEKHPATAQAEPIAATPPPADPAESADVAAPEKPGVHKGEMGRLGPPKSMKRAAGAPSGGVTTARPISPPPAFEAPPVDREAYDHIAENDFVAVADDPQSTFSIDVDTASYSNVRRFLRDGQLPPADAVRIEELVNYFAYAYPSPIGPDPFSLSAEVSECPWNEAHRLVRVGLQGKVVDQSETPPRNLVFLLDVSGSMNDPDKLPLLKRGLAMLVADLRPQDSVALAVYAGASGLVLPPTKGTRKAEILDALERLEAGGSTNGGAGINLAYDLAARSFVKGGINRVILATDGDFNVGVTSRGELTRLIEDKRQTGVFLSVLGFGSGNLQDATMEELADKGNGNYAYIDSVKEARKVLVEQAGSTLVTIAKDVKIQVEFNPTEVRAYRLVGYENRKLAHTDFNDDSKDAGEIGAGHAVTALYEVVPADGRSERIADALKYQADRNLTSAAGSGELMHVKVRYQQPEGSKSKLLDFPITDDDRALSATSDDFRFAAAVAEFGMLLRNSEHKGRASFAEVERLASAGLGSDPHGHRREFVELVATAARLRAKESSR